MEINKANILNFIARRQDYTRSLNATPSPFDEFTTSNTKNEMQKIKNTELIVGL